MPPPGSQPSRASARETRPVQRLRYAASQPVQRRRPAPSPPPPREEPAPIPDPDPDLHQEAGELELEEGGAEVQQQVQERVPVRLGTVGAEEIMELEELRHGGGEEEGAGGEGAEEIGPEAAVRGEALLQPVGRRLRGAEAEQGDVASRLDPEIPGPRNGAPLVDADGWREIDRLGAWECAMNMFSSMEEVPFCFRVGWGKAVTRVITAVLNATNQEELDRALKWLLILPAAFLRQARRGGQNGRGRAEVAGRFRAAVEDNWGFLITSLMADMAREERRRQTERRRVARPAMSEDEIKRQKRKAALTHLAKGQVSKAVSRLTSHGVADTRNPTVMTGLKSKYVRRSRELPASVTMGQPVDNVGGLKEALLSLGTGSSPGTGGMRGEFLTTLGEVLLEGEMTRLEDFAMLYLTGALPAWFYGVWGSVTTVPLYKTRERSTLRPVGVMTPLIRTLHSMVIRENKSALTSFLEPQQLCLSLSGGHKLVNAVRMLLEENPDFVCFKLDLRNAHNEVARAAILEELEEEPTLRHLVWHAATVLAPGHGLEIGGVKWGDQEEGERQGDGEASAFFSVALQKDVVPLDAAVAISGGAALFGNDDGYVIAPLEVARAALSNFKLKIRDRCGLHLQEDKTELYSQRELTPAELNGMKRAGVQLDGGFAPGFVCYGIPVGSPQYVNHELKKKAEEVVNEVEEITEILGEDSQALWVVLHRSLAHKMDYHLSLCYPSDIRPIAAYLDSVFWSMLERAAGQQIPRADVGLGYECMLDLPVESMAGKSFQELFVRTPIKLRGFGLRSLVESVPAAFIGGVERSVSAFGGEEGVCRKLEHLLGGGGEGTQWWRHLLDSDTCTGREFHECWNFLQQEARECSEYLGRELDGTISAGPDIAAELREGGSSRQLLTEQREELREAVLREALLRHPNQTARPAIAYPQLDKLSTAWKLGLPGPTTGLTTPVFREVMALHLFLPSLACKEVVGQRVGARGAVAGHFGDELMCAQLPGDSWRWRHDDIKLCIVNICNESKVRAEAEVFGRFRDLLPPHLTEAGGELQYGRQRVGLTPDLLLRIPSPDGVVDRLGEIKAMSAGVSRYPAGKTEKQADRRARELPGSYRRPLERLDQELRGTAPGDTGALVARLQGFGELMCLVAGAWGDCSKDLHSLIQTCAESKVEHLCRSTGRPELEGQLSVIVSQYRRRLSTCIVRAQAQCLLSRVGVISPQAREAAQRREVAGRMERQLREDRRAQWMASLRGPGWARQGRCHMVI